MNGVDFWSVFIGVVALLVIVGWFSFRLGREHGWQVGYKKGLDDGLGIVADRIRRERPRPKDL